MNDNIKDFNPFEYYLYTDSVMLSRHSLDGKYKEVSPSCKAILGYEPDEMIGVNPYNLFHPDDIVSIQKSHATILYKENDYIITYRLKKKNGDYTWVETHNKTIRDKVSGEPIEIVCVTRDVNDRKNSENAIKESQMHYRTLVESMNEGMLQVDLNDIMIFANHQFLKMTGYELEELKGKVFYNVFCDDDGKELLKHKSELRMNGISDKFVLKLYKKNQQEIWAEISASPIKNANNIIIGSIGVLTDITEKINTEQALKQSEEEFNYLFNAANDAIILFEPENEIILEANKRACEVYGYTSKELIGKSLKELTVNIKRGEDYLQELLAKGSYIEFESLHYKKDGTIFNVIINSSVVNYNNRKTVLSIHRDITERVHTEQKLKEYAIELEASNKVKDKFLSIISHDLKSPYQGFLGVTKMISEQADTIDREYLKVISEELYKTVKNQYRLLTDLLEWAKLQNRELKINPVKLSLNLVTNEIIKQLSLPAAQKTIEIKNNIPESFFVSADENMIKLVIRNLLNNAIKFTFNGGSIKITAQETKDNYRISITDTGKGIAKEEVDRILSGDKRFSTEGTAKETGYGLGLMLCREILAKHKSELMIESHSGLGSTFSFLLNKVCIE